MLSTQMFPMLKCRSKSVNTLCQGKIQKRKVEFNGTERHN